VKIDLHTHSEASKDGGISPEHYAKILREEIVDVIAITDHDRIDFALGMQKALGKDQIIVGQEVTTSDGDIIGLYLKKPIDKGKTAKEAVRLIKEQNGLVMVPHPFETLRKGISKHVLDEIAKDVDIIEGRNGRAVLQNFSAEAIAWGKRHNKLIVGNSDAHGFKGVGKTYTVIENKPKTKEELLLFLHEARFTYKRPPLITLLYPSLNMLKKKFQGI
jgi:hypothetical protein